MKHVLCEIGEGFQRKAQQRNVTRVCRKKARNVARVESTGAIKYNNDEHTQSPGLVGKIPRAQRLVALFHPSELLFFYHSALFRLAQVTIYSIVRPSLRAYGGAWLLTTTSFGWWMGISDVHFDLAQRVVKYSVDRPFALIHQLPTYRIHQYRLLPILP